MLAKLFSDNYNYLNTVAIRITRHKDPEMAPDLLSETYLNLSEKGTVVPSNNEEFVKFFCTCMKNYFTWPNSSFNKLYQPKEFLTLDNDFYLMDNAKSNQQKYLDSFYSNKHSELVIDEDALKNIEINAEQTNDFTKELFEISSSMGREKTLKYIEVIEFKRSLPPHENILFDLYFEKELSTRGISSMYSDQVNKLSRISVNRMINKIKTKIKNHKWNSSDL